MSEVSMFGSHVLSARPKAVQELLAEAGFPKGFKTQLTAIFALEHKLMDAVQLAQRYLKDVGIEEESKLQESGAYRATTTQDKDDGGEGNFT
jgi:ABC-type transport system substrate-binding protein